MVFTIEKTRINDSTHLQATVEKKNHFNECKKRKEWKECKVCIECTLLQSCVKYEQIFTIEINVDYKIRLMNAYK